MTQDYRTKKREALEEVNNDLARQYKAALTQSVTTIDAGAATQAEQSAKAIDQRMKEIQDQLDELDVAVVNPLRQHDPGPDPARLHDQLKEHLHRIDYRQVERVLRGLLDGDEDRGRAGLLAFQQCGRMQGRLAVERIVTLLKDESGGLFRHFEVVLQPGDRNDSGALLRHLAAHLKVDLDERSLEQQLGLVSERLCGSMQAGSIALIDIGSCDWLAHDDPAALRWVVSDFWPRLLADLESVARRLPAVTLIALLSFDDQLPKGALAPMHCCTIDQPARQRLLEVELCAWTLHEVEEWLIRWGMRGRQIEDIRLMAKSVMNFSNGLPSLIANELLRRCATPQPTR